MKTKKHIIMLTFLVSIVSFISSILFNFVQAGSTNNFYYDISISFFTSSSSILLISIIEYIFERKKNLESFMTEIQNEIQIIGNISFCNVIELNINDIADGENIIPILHSYIDLSKNCHVNLDSAYANLDFIFQNKKTKNWIYTDIYSRIKNFYSTLSVISFHFQTYIDSHPSGNTKAMLDFLNNIQKEIFTCSTSFSVDAYSLRIYNSLYDDLLDSFYKLQYLTYKNKSPKNPTHEKTLVLSFSIPHKI